MNTFALFIINKYSNVLTLKYLKVCSVGRYRRQHFLGICASLILYSLESRSPSLLFSALWTESSRAPVPPLNSYYKTLECKDYTYLNPKAQLGKRNAIKVFDLYCSQYQCDRQTNPKRGHGKNPRWRVRTGRSGPKIKIHRRAWQ